MTQGLNTLPYKQEDHKFESQKLTKMILMSVVATCKSSLERQTGYPQSKLASKTSHFLEALGLIKKPCLNE